MGLVPVVLAVVVLAFSLQNQPGALGTNLAPDAYVGQNAAAALSQLTGKGGFPARRPGSRGDMGAAGYVASRLTRSGFSVSKDFYTAGTVDGRRALENVVGTRAGAALVPGTIAVVADRDALGSPARAQLSGTAVMLELARILGGQTLHHTLALASITGSVGAVGAAQLARDLPQPVEAVIVLGDLGGIKVREPVVVPWSDGRQVAPMALRNTLAAALRTQAGLRPSTNSLGGQIAHLAFPMASSEQAAFGSAGLPAVLVSRSAEQSPAATEPVDPARMTAMGRGVLEALGALDSGPSLPGPSTYLLWSGKVVPGWAIRLLVLVLIIPVAAATIDALARARRRRLPILGSAVWVLAAALPFAVACVLVGLAHLVGLIPFAPGIPVHGGTVPLGSAGTLLLVLMACAIVGGLVWLRSGVSVVSGVRAARDGDAAPAAFSTALLAVLCAISLLVWLANPFAALLIVPSLHLWMWVVAGRGRLPLPILALLVAGGLVLPALVALYWAFTLGVGPVGLAWSGVLLLAGGGLAWATVLEWSLFAGCAVCVIALTMRASRQAVPESAPITVRGPVTYAGPGSLGGTRSALRR
jgi:hypothetical protein